MASETDICNLSLSHLGVGKEIANIDTERSQESLACRRFFDMARDATLRDFPWPFAAKTAALGLVTDSDDDDHPTTEWAYSYRYPTDCLDAKRILSGSRNDTRQSRVPYIIVHDSAGALIYTDQDEAVLEYTSRVEDPGRYPPDFIMALSCRLAFYIAPRLTAGDPFKLGARAMELYRHEIAHAHASARNEEQHEQDPDSEFIRVRE